MQEEKDVPDTTTHFTQR